MKMGFDVKTALTLQTALLQKAISSQAWAGP
jgi:hypothetical protein